MKVVLVIRKFDDFSRILAENGFEIVNLPLIETKAVENLSGFETRLEKIETYDGIFLTSKTAAQILAAGLREKKINYGGKVYVLGQRSFEILKPENLNIVFFEEANTALEMLEKIAPEDLTNGRFLFVRGEKSLRVVPEFLEKRATFDETIVYRTEKIAPETGKIRQISERIKNGEIAAACFFSPSAAESFSEQFDTSVLHQTLIAAIGTTTAEFFERRGLKVDFIAAKATAKDFAFELIKYLGRNLTTDKYG